jgi:hypothetical protein
MKRVFVVILVLLAGFLAAQEKLDTRWVFTNAVGANASQIKWSIKGTAADTSAIIDMRPYMSIQYCFNDTTHGEDSLKVRIVLQTTLNPGADSCWVNQATIESSLSTCGWRPVTSLAAAESAYGRIIVTGLTGNNIKTASTGWLKTCGWTNQVQGANTMR